MKIRLLLAGIVFISAGLPLSAQSAWTVKYQPGSALQVRAVSSALEYIGTPYVFGGMTAKGLDCSGLVSAVFQEITDFPLPRRAEDLYKVGIIADTALLPGDLVFFDTAGGPTHVGIYSGDGYFIHAASDGPETGVIVSSLSEKYYRDTYLGARRILDWRIPTFEIAAKMIKGQGEFTRSLPPALPLRFKLIGPDESSAFWSITLLLNGEQYLKKRVRLGPRSGSSLMFYTRTGDWTIDVESENGIGKYMFQFKVLGTEPAS